LTGQIESAATEADSLADVEALLPVVAELASLDPGNGLLETVGADLAGRLTAELDAAREAERLPEVEDYLRRAVPVWTALGQPQMTAPAEERRRALIDRQEELATLARQAIGHPEMRADDGRSAMALITEARAIDPDDP